jgi:hypothetical protein
MNVNNPVALSDSLKTAHSSGWMPAASGTPLTDSVLSSSFGGRASSISTLPHSRGIAFIDTSVSDYQTLAAGIAAGTEVHLLDSSEDAVTQITNTLLGRDGISSIHIVSHGAAGGLDFGAGKLNLSNLPSFASQLQSWSNALTKDADILLYGCNVAQGELGKAFVKILSQLTGADVAASADLTGSASKGGNWTLEYETGSIETGLAVSSAILDYEGVLDDAVYTAALHFTSGNVTAEKVFTDSSGNVYTTGTFQGTVDFDPGNGIATLTNTGTRDSFISKLDSSGNYVWSKQLGGTGDDQATSISVDSSGNVYTTGTFQGTADFDPGTGTANLTSAGLSDIFISKLDSSGNYVWAKQLGGTSTDVANGISVDSSGNVYTTGFFSGTADFDPGNGTANLTSAGLSDSFISKLDSSGNYVWAKQLGGTSTDVANGISVDSSGNVYTTGTFQGTADFDPGAGIATLTNTGTRDSFISKLDSSGNYVWVKKLGGTSDDRATSISVDSSGNVYTTGTFQGTADFDPGNSTANLTSAGLSDIFISKLDSSGNYVWAKQLGGIDYDQANDISVDSSGNVYTTGAFQGTADFDPGNGTANLTSAGNTDIFISKLDSSGNYIWTKQLGGTDYDQANGISVDSSGNVYTTGTFTGRVDFDPGARMVKLMAGKILDSFISKLDSSGNYAAAQQFTSGSVTAQKVVTDSNGNVYTMGTFTGTVDFDPDTNTVNLLSAGGTESFISKLNSSGNYVWAKQLGGTSLSGTSTDVVATNISVDSSGNVYTAGYFQGMADFDPGTGVTNLISAAGSYDIFISKLDSSGNYIWVKQLGGTSSDSAAGISVDSSGNVYTTGNFSGTVDFDPGAGSANLTSAGSYDIFISKLDSSGNYIWSKKLGGTSSDSAAGISVDSSGNVYTTGSFQGTVDFDPGTNTVNLISAGNTDSFISKLDSSGNYIWAKKLGGTSFDQATDISVDSSGNVYTTGFFQGTADFDPDAGSVNLTSVAGSYDSFISKLDSSGNYIWAKQLGGTSSDSAAGISVDSSGNVYTTGTFYGTADFDPGAGSANLTSVGDRDIFISKLSSSGSYLWAKQFGGTSDDRAKGINVDSSGNVYTTGTFYGTADFDPGVSTVNLMAGGTNNSFISKLSQVPNLAPTLTVSAMTLDYTENDLATVIDPTATVTDSDSTDFDMGTLTVSYSANGSADDRLAIRDQGTGTEQIGIAGSTVTYGGTTIGTFTGGTGTTALVITFNTSATAIAVTALLQNLTYANVSDTPSTAARTLQFLMTDGDGGTSSAATKTIHVTAVNDELVNLLWRSNNLAISSSGSGQDAIWQMNGFTLESSYYLPTVADANWQIISTADFNHDGTDDLLWRNQATGENAIWQLDSTGFQSSRFITPITDLNWKMISTADFNGDGIADILWRNQASGQNAIWQMNSTDVQTGYYLTPIADLNWKMISTADFNGDGIADILWRNQASGQNAIWQMKRDFTLQSGRFITPIADSNWQIVGTGDFNHDGIADLVWRNQATGQNAIWQMNSTDVQTGYYLTPVADVNWQIASIADFDGDGSADLLWRNAQASTVGIWQMNGFTESQAYLLPDVSPDWVVRPLRAPQASVPA